MRQSGRAEVGLEAIHEEFVELDAFLDEYLKTFLGLLDSFRVLVVAVVVATVFRIPFQLPLPFAAFLLGDSKPLAELLDSFVEAVVPEAMGDVLAQGKGAVRQ